jgi:hypothetical protein
VQSRLLLDVVVGKGTAILKLLACENQALLVRRNALLVLDLGLDIVDGIAGLNLKGDGLAGDCGELAGKIQKGGEQRMRCWQVAVNIATRPHRVRCGHAGGEAGRRLTGLDEDLHDGRSAIR